MNLRPSGYEPDELPGCSTPRWFLVASFQFPEGLYWQLKTGNEKLKRMFEDLAATDFPMS